MALDIIRRVLAGDFDNTQYGTIAPCRQQNRNVLDLLTACCRARLDGSAAPTLLPTEAELAAA